MVMGRMDFTGTQLEPFPRPCRVNPMVASHGNRWGVPLFAFEGLDSLFALRHRGHDSASLIYVLTPGHLHAPVYASTRIL